MWPFSNILYYPPLKPMPDIPLRDHYGSFGVCRKFDRHCGVDLYTPDKSPVFAIERGKVVEVSWFTGPKANFPIWEDTRAVCVEGDSGVIVYGEIMECDRIKVGYKIDQGEVVGNVKTVLKKYKGKPTSMLHVMLLKHGCVESMVPVWDLNVSQYEGLLDPTPILLLCRTNYLNHFIKSR